MKRFRFNLEKLLELRKYDERKFEIELGQIVSKCSSIEHKIKEFKSNKTNIFYEYNLENSGIDVLQIAEIYIQKINSEINKSQSRLDGFLLEKQKMQEKYIRSSNKRKILDKLKDKQELSYYKKQAAEELKEIDDISIDITFRKRIQEEQTA